VFLEKQTYYSFRALVLEVKVAAAAMALTKKLDLIVILT